MPPGYHVVETDTVVDHDLTERKRTGWGARRCARQANARRSMDSYRWEPRRVGRLRWVVEAKQNILEETA